MIPRSFYIYLKNKSVLQLSNGQKVLSAHCAYIQKTNIKYNEQINLIEKKIEE